MKDKMTNAVFILTAVLLAGTGHAQEKIEAATIEAAMKGEQIKHAGTFWSKTMQMPPLPYHPFPDLPTA